MSSLDEYAANRLDRLLQSTPSAYSPARGPQREHPAGWEPGVRWDGAEGTVTSRPTEESAPDWGVLLRSWGFDPADFEVVEPVDIRTWDAYGKDEFGELVTKQLWYHRAKIRRRVAADDRPDVDALAAEIRRHKAPKRPAPAGDRTLVVCLSDWQAGKGEGGGTPALVERILAAIDAVSCRIKATKVARIVVLGMGDLVEGCGDHYAQQTFTVDLDRRDQVKLVRRLVVKALQTWAPLASSVVVAAVGGNHGENRRDGKSYTTFADNDDVAVFEQVAEIMAANPEAYGHVSFVIPRDELSITLNVGGVVLGLAHGHQARRGATPQARVANWWSGQAFGGQPVGDATVLVTGHYHSLSVVEHGGRTHMQCPALDGGSAWFTNTTGEHSRAGVLTFTLGEGGWNDLAVL